MRVLIQILAGWKSRQTKELCIGGVQLQLLQEHGYKKLVVNARF